MASYWSLTNQRRALLCVDQSEVSIYLAVCAWEEACLDCSCSHNQRSYYHTPGHEEVTEWCWELSVV